jgi:hypothetical protein
MTVYDKTVQFPVRPDNVFPLVVGYKYRLKPAGSGQWVTIVSMDAKNVYAQGIGNHKMPLTSIPRWKFDDEVEEYSTT